jgi:hypothetical protein
LRRGWNFGDLVRVRHGGAAARVVICAVMALQRAKPYREDNGGGDSYGNSLDRSTRSLIDRLDKGLIGVSVRRIDFRINCGVDAAPFFLCLTGA